jgi:single-strand DNA-binding protein
VTGRLGRDPEVRVTASGKSVASFSIALDDGFGEKKTTLWLPVEVWDKTAEAIGRLVTAGKRVTVVGRIKEDTWNDAKTGEKRSKLKILANQIDIIDFAEKDEGAEDVPF